MSGPRTVRLGDCVDFLSGFAFGSRRFNTDGDGIPVIRVRDVKPGRSRTYYSGPYDPKYLISDGDYVIGMDGEFALSRWRGGRAVLNQRVCSPRPLSPGIDLAYVAHFLPPVLKRIEDATPFATVRHLSVKTLRDIELTVPSLPEQRRVVTVLEQVEELREKRRRTMALLDDLAESVFLDMFGDPASPAPRYPRVPLKDAVSRRLQNGAHFPGEAYGEDGVAMVHMADAFHGTVGGQGLRRVACQEKDIATYGLTGHDLLVARRSFTYEGSAKPCRVIAPGEPLIFESSLIRVTPAPALLTTRYLHAYLSHQRVRAAYVLPRVTGATITGISQENLARIPVLLPPLAQQRAFERRLEQTDRVRATYQAQLDSLGELFASIRPRAFAGTLWKPEAPA
ncbi:restriction endonuclease subunit S [Streptomyces sp. NPDC093261]|uniref:restriction endonuclease subunit S n=1 Tax=Streptomyces sp. NPDC093261 TaxID=3366037 RepID=UPI00382372B8